METEIDRDREGSRNSFATESEVKAAMEALNRPAYSKELHGERAGSKLSSEGETMEARKSLQDQDEERLFKVREGLASSTPTFTETETKSSGKAGMETYIRYKACSACGGDGKKFLFINCGVCGGSGRVEAYKEVRHF